jgi:glycosyltransferase involved in cell wall biosynthesis
MNEPPQGATAPAQRPLRVLIAHNRYQLRGGEDAVVEAESELLRQHGHAVEIYSRHNDELAALSSPRAAADSVWSGQTTADIRRLVHSFKPDVLHVHNTVLRMSPSVFHAASQMGLATVMTLHNFRLMCPQGLLLRNSRPCEDCVGKLPWRAVAHGCYRGSRAQTAVVTAGDLVHRAMGTWRARVDRFIALNAFCRERFIAGGIAAEKLRIKPNFIDLEKPAAGPRDGFLFVGRLSEEKGVAVLAQALHTNDIGERVRVVGEGPAQALLAGSPKFELLGKQAPEFIYRLMARSRALILPSIWYENYPRTLVEAFACGLPVIASRLGAMAALIKHGHNGLLFNPGDGTDLARTLAWAQTHPDEMAVMGAQARSTYEAELTGASNYRQLISIYDEAIACHSH